VGAALAVQQGQTARAAEFLERSLEIEAEHLPEIVNLSELGQDYGALMAGYQQLADALRNLASISTPPI
jgi:Tfp pilus assembly protein PilF